MSKRKGLNSFERYVAQLVGVHWQQDISVLTFSLLYSDMEKTLSADLFPLSISMRLGSFAVLPFSFQPCCFRSSCSVLFSNCSVNHWCNTYSKISLCGFFRAVVAAEVERWTIGYVVIVFLEYDDRYGQLCPAVADAYKIPFFHIVAISSASNIYGVYVIRASVILFFVFIYKKNVWVRGVYFRLMHISTR